VPGKSPASITKWPTKSNRSRQSEHPTPLGDRLKCGHCTYEILHSGLPARGPAMSRDDRIDIRVDFATQERPTRAADLSHQTLLLPDRSSPCGGRPHSAGQRTAQALAPRQRAVREAVSATAIQLDLLPKKTALPNPVPAALLGCLAVDPSCQGSSIGKLLLIKRSHRASADVATHCVALHTRDDAARSFYLRFGSPSSVTTRTTSSSR
jgi:hypothetical protein